MEGGQKNSQRATSGLEEKHGNKFPEFILPHIAQTRCWRGSNLEIPISSDPLSCPHQKKSLKKSLLS